MVVLSGDPPAQGLRVSRIWMRGLDIGIACAALVLLGPLMLLIALAIVLESGRPVLFVQPRLGQQGRLFKMLKFRKFHRNCGTDGLPLTLEGDARLTAVGRILKDTKFDELPQFWNVLKGDMAVVGPRPEVPVFSDCFTGDFRRILDHRPGLLGPTQVLFRRESELYPDAADLDGFYRRHLFPAKARIDLEYYRRRTPRSDLEWVVKGILATIGLFRMAPPDLAPSGRDARAAIDGRKPGFADASEVEGALGAARRSVP